MHTKHWGDARTIPTLPGQANSTDSKNNMTPWLQKKQTTHCKALAPIFYLKVGTAASKFLYLGIYGNIVGEQ